MQLPLAYVVVRHRGEIVATIGPERVWLQPEVEALATDHPRRRFVGMLCLVGREMQRGTGAEPYDDRRASAYARALLMPEDEFDRLSAALDDAALAVRFGVPLAEVRTRRAERSVAGRRR